MDWSLLQTGAKKPLLRDVRGYKNPNYYYGAMILDVLLRFNWIFYAIYTSDVQHSTLVAFLVAFSEVTRRGVWVIFRVENEHCANVARFKASRDVPLPYELPSEIEAGVAENEAEAELGTGGSSTGRQHDSPAMSRIRSHVEESLESQPTNTSSTMRRRNNVPFTSPGLKRTFTKIVADAHTQDFEKKRKPGVGKDSNAAGKEALGKQVEVEDDADSLGGSSSGSGEDDEEENIIDAHKLLRERAGTLERDGRSPRDN